MDGVYRWVVFLPSRVDERVAVANRYFGVFQSGEIKVRGIEARRRDTAPFISETQMAIMEILAKAEDADGLKDVLPKAQAFVQKQMSALRMMKVPVEKLLVSQKLSRELGEYSTPSPAARTCPISPRWRRSTSRASRSRRSMWPTAPTTPTSEA